MTDQEAFDAAVSGVVKQGRPSVDHQGVCLYRGPDGLRCAVGWLIPDETYDADMEGENITWLQASWPRALAACDNTSLMQNLQRAHDDAAYDDAVDFLWEFKRLARIVAYDFGLDPAVAD